MAPRSPRPPQLRGRPTAGPHQLSPEAHARLSAELSDLTVRGRVEIAKRIEEARELGDLSENGDYHAAKDEQGKMELRIRQIQGMLEDVRLVDAGPADGSVRVGSVVTLDFGDDEPERYLVGNIEEQRDDAAILSPDAPLGQAVLERSAGEHVTYEVTKGTSLTVKIVSVE